VRLKNNVFETRDFKEYADGNLVLLEIDFPRHKRQKTSLKEQNRSLADAFGITGYPSVFLCDAQGHMIRKLGPLTGDTTEEVIAKIEAGRKK